MSVSDITCAALATVSDTQGVKLSWTYSDPRNGSLPNIALDVNEVWAASVNDRADGSFAKVGEGITDFLHAGLSRGAVRYYWVRARDKIGGFGAYYPSGATSGVSGTEASGDIAITNPGYWKFPNGLIFQYGSQSNAAVTFAIPFPNGIFSVVATSAAPGAATKASIIDHTNITLSGFTAVVYDTQNGGTLTANSGEVFSYIAIGY